MGPYALLWFYRRRLRVHGVQELLAGVGVAVAVALVFATTVAAHSIAGSAREVIDAVIGPATLQLHARKNEGFKEKVLKDVERLPGVKQAAPLLEQTATIQSGRHSVTVDLAGADTALVVLDGLGHTIPRQTLSAGGIGLSGATAKALDIAAPAAPGAPGAGSQRTAYVTLKLGGQAYRLRVSAVLGPEAFGALSSATVAVMPLQELQRLAGLHRRVSRVLVQVKPGAEAKVRAGLIRIAGGRIDVASARQDVSLLHQALRPSDEANGLFAAVATLLGLLFAVNALLLTVPERRRAIADLRVIGVKRTAIVEMVIFQALALGILASGVGLLGGYLLSLDVLHQSPRYLSEAFTLGNGTVVAAQPLLLSLSGGLLAACLASGVPLLDLRRDRALDAVYRPGLPFSGALPRRLRRGLLAATAILLAASSALFALSPSQALLSSCLLALSAVLAVPLTFSTVMRAARALARSRPEMTVLPVALISLRGTTLRALALAATGAAALFGSVALGGARSDLLKGIGGFAHSYSSDAAIWIGTPGDNQAVVPFDAGNLPQRLAHVPGVASVSAFHGGFIQLDGRRVWVIARPQGGDRHVLASQLLQGGGAATQGRSANPVASDPQAGLAATEARLAEGGWVVVSKQIAQAQHTRLGGRLSVPTPSGVVSLRIAATSTNLAWSPGAIFIGAPQWERLWHSSAPTALSVKLTRGANVKTVLADLERLVARARGLEAVSAGTRQAKIDRLTREGLHQLGEISTLLLIAAVLAMAAALTSSIWQRRAALAALRLAGVKPRRLRMILLVESTLILGAGCATGALAGVYGEVVIDAYLRHVTGFPVASLGTSAWPLQVFALVAAFVLIIVAIPGWLASKVSPAVAFGEQ